MDVMTAKEYTEKSKLLARIIVQAYGKSPLVYDDLEEQVIAAFLFGIPRAFSVAAGVLEWQCTMVMMELMADVLGFPMDMADSALDYLRECLNKPEEHQVMNLVIHCGDDAYGLLGDQEELSAQIKEIVYIMGQKLYESL